MSPPPRLPRKPEARTEKVEDLVERVRRGLVRVPGFQRPLNWDSSNVLELFDSIYRGYPIGSLLFYKRPAAAERLEVGPLVVEAPETTEAWWVVDGQQRITALAACLLRSVPIPTRPNRKDPHVLYFDAEKQRFELPPPDGQIPPTWVPLPYLLDASQLTEWMYNWGQRSESGLRRLVFEVGARIREYPIPLYLIETGGGSDADDREVAEEIFYRTNNTGNPLQWTEVHTALFGGEKASPSTLEELAQELLDVGMGQLSEERLLTCLVALRGKDPTRTLAEHLRRDREFLSGAVVEALPVLRRVLSFLRQEAGIPHLRFLPKTILLDVLTRFFARHADPRPRTRMLLSRWFWRIVLGAGAVEDRTLRRRGILAVDDDEEETAQKLLELVRKERPRTLDLPALFDARADDSRLAMLALAHLHPRHLGNGERIDVAQRLEEADREAFVKIVTRSVPGHSRSPANRILQAREGQPVRTLLLDRISQHGVDDPVLESHAIDALAAECLRVDDVKGFLVRRAEHLTAEVRHFAERMAAWDHSDRPSIDYILGETGEKA